LPDPSCSRALHAGKEYFLCSAGRAWASARDNCTSVGAHLIEIDDAAENSFAIGLSKGDFLWAGGHDRDTEGQWSWSESGARFWQGGSGGQSTNSAGVGPCTHPADQGCMFSDWEQDEPGNSTFSPGNPDCLAVGAYQGTAAWYDVGCDSSEVYLCELP